MPHRNLVLGCLAACCVGIFLFAQLVGVSGSALYISETKREKNTSEAKVEQGSIELPALTIATGYYPPFTSERLPHHGFANHVVSEALLREGYQAKFAYYPWARARQQVVAGHIAASSYWGCSQEYAKIFYCSEPILEIQFRLFYRKSDPLPAWSELKHHPERKIGLTRGYFYTAEIQQARRDWLNHAFEQSDEQQIKKLLAGRIDGFILEEPVYNNLIRSMKLENLAEQITFDKATVFISQGTLLFSREHPESPALLDVFNRGLIKLHGDGGYQRLESLLRDGHYQVSSPLRE